MHRPSKTQLWRLLLFGFVLAGGITAITLLVLLPSKSSRARDEIGPFTMSGVAPHATTSKEYVKPNMKVDSVKNGLTGSLFRSIPSYFELAFSINIKAFKTFFWAHSLFTLSSQPNLRRQIDSLELSLSGIDSVGVGFLPRRNTVSFPNQTLKLTMPPLMFLFYGPKGRMEALRTIWKKNEGKGNLFKQGNFQLGFPMGPKPHSFVGSYRTDLTPIMRLAEKPDAGYDLCGAMECTPKIAALGLIPDAIFIYHPKRPLHVKANLRLAGIIAAMEFNPDGVLFRADIATNLPCLEAATKLKKFIRRSLSRLKYKQSFFDRAIVQCRQEKHVLVTISSASSEIRHHIVQLGLLPK